MRLCPIKKAPEPQGKRRRCQLGNGQHGIGICEAARYRCCSSAEKPRHKALLSFSLLLYTYSVASRKSRVPPRVVVCGPRMRRHGSRTIYGARLIDPGGEARRFLARRGTEARDGSLDMPDARHFRRRSRVRPFPSLRTTALTNAANKLLPLDDASTVDDTCGERAMRIAPLYRASAKTILVLSKRKRRPVIFGLLETARLWLGERASVTRDADTTAAVFVRVCLSKPAAASARSSTASLSL
ncbi:hypothetical protein HPB50_005065 [Hyalomma asiaticum]|uniref:Uncharacterized protein n=1 Tax=Hyalomma asiaticum TaxID=266040 RepID=A0ACB7SNG0_HYAAI|nr:hypothetical protein HPB50_005065 [Hyalomma asiaticum]